MGGHGDQGGTGGDANASSTARTNGFGDALSSANATGGANNGGSDEPGLSGNANATANASAAGGGKAIAMAIATTPVIVRVLPPNNANNATSNAVTVNGAMAQALSTVVGPSFGPAGQATSTAKTRLAGVSVQSSATAASVDNGLSPPDTATTEAIAQGRSGQTSVAPAETAAIATALPDKVYATTLIGDASNVADALLGPGDEIFGAAILATAGEPGVFATRRSIFRFRAICFLAISAMIPSSTWVPAWDPTLI
ncbi:MAG TPA: hypothetical protein VNY10_09300 [Roseiarcus sp.]|nr:hypothetical protein [Roseiarcus sp.]